MDDTNSAQSRPLKNSYWVIPGRLLAGEYPGSWDSKNARLRLQGMLSMGFTRFIDLTTQADGLEPYEQVLHDISGGEAKRLSFGIPDMDVPADRQHMALILDSIDRELSDGRMVYVHCWGGIGRTGTVIGCWLKRHGRDDLRDLWKTNPKSSHYPNSPQTDDQQAFIDALVEPR